MSTIDWIGYGLEWGGAAIAIFAVIYGMFFTEIVPYSGDRLIDLLLRR